MVVLYGNFEVFYYCKYVFDQGEYGVGYMINSLFFGCDCKGFIYYMDVEFFICDGGFCIIKNVICIYEEDVGIFFKYSDFCDDFVIVICGCKLIIQ